MFKVKNIILSLALLGCSGLAQAQQVEQRIDSLQILIGQQTVLHLKASVKQGDKVQLPSFKPQQQITPGVEVVEQSKGDTSHIGDDRMVVSRDYTLTSFDEKVYVIPALNVKVNGKNCHGNQLALKVLTVPVDTVHPNQFYPPKDVQDNPFSWSEWSALFWLSLLLLILCGAWLYLRNRLKNNKPVLRPTDRKWNKAAQESKLEVKVRPVPTFIARFLAGVIAIAIVALILLVLFGLFLQVFQWVAGMVR